MLSRWRPLSRCSYANVQMQLCDMMEHGGDPMDMMDVNVPVFLRQLPGSTIWRLSDGDSGAT